MLTGILDHGRILFGKVCTHFEDLFAVLGENPLMPESLVLRIEHGPWPVGLVVILQLKGITTHEYLRWSDETAKHLLIVAHKIQISVVRSIACHNQQYRESEYSYSFFFAQVLAKTTAAIARIATQDRWIVAAKSVFFIK